MANTSDSDSNGLLTCSEQHWAQLYDTLRPTIRAWVHSSQVAVWRGREYDLTEEILQETVARAFERLQQNEPIHNLTGYSKRIAFHHFLDLRKKELKLIPLPEYLSNDGIALYKQEEVDPAELAIEHLSLISLAETVLDFTADMPAKRRNALFVDLVKRANFLDESSPLLIACSHFGIRLQDFLPLLPHNRDESSRHASLLHLAYKQLKKTFWSKGKRKDTVA